MDYVYHTAKSEGKHLFSVLWYRIISHKHFEHTARLLAIRTRNTSIIEPLLLIHRLTSSLPHKDQFNSLYQSQSITAASGARMGGAIR